MLETMNLKAAPAGPGPDFVERTRPSADDLGYIPTSLPHKVSSLPVKKASEVEAQKTALDAAAKRQRDPAVPAQPLGKRVTGAKAAKAAD